MRKFTAHFHFWLNYTFEFKCMHFDSLYRILDTSMVKYFGKCEHFPLFWFGLADISIEWSRIPRGLKPAAVKSSIIQRVPAGCWCGRCLSVALFIERMNPQMNKRGRLSFCQCFLRRNNKREGLKELWKSQHIFPLWAFLPRIWMITFWGFMRSLAIHFSKFCAEMFWMLKLMYTYAASQFA